MACRPSFFGPGGCGQVFGHGLDLRQCGPQVAEDSGGDVLGLGQGFLRVVVAEPRNVEVIATSRDLLTGEAAEAACMTFILTGGTAVRVLAKRRDELREVAVAEWP